LKPAAACHRHAEGQACRVQSAVEQPISQHVQGNRLRTLTVANVIDADSKNTAVEGLDFLPMTGVSNGIFG
jgi:hypothetical protein